jgi:hypothetical protein
MNWIKKFVINRLIYMVLLTVLCLGIFPFMILYPTTMLIGEILDKFFAGSKRAAKIDKLWNIIGIPYDALVKLAD